MHCYVTVIKQRNKAKFLFKGSGTIHKSLLKLRKRTSRYLSVFSPNRLCLYKSQAYAANYCANGKQRILTLIKCKRTNLSEVTTKPDRWLLCHVIHHLISERTQHILSIMPGKTPKFTQICVLFFKSQGGVCVFWCIYQAGNRCFIDNRLALMLFWDL